MDAAALFGNALTIGFFVALFVVVIAGTFLIGEIPIGHRYFGPADRPIREPKPRQEPAAVLELEEDERNAGLDPHERTAQEVEAFLKDSTRQG